ncbi:nucleoporin GLE1-like [Sinocyclocheilus grahami]|uniref:nucleoporin GLE1-like n=1 Tax=Sinocyclocheilus grahami TaxID=75366 RepID=UPI0007AC92DB|nr:PREDICTED: nucleoporin GLE1-like [Sinocyclocheilus grahami]
MEVSSLSPLSGQILKRLSPHPRLKTCSLTSCVRDTSPGLSEDVAAGASFPVSPRQSSSPTSPPPVSIHSEEDEQKIWSSATLLSV